MDDLFGPPLMKGEDKVRYFRLLAAVEYDFKPQTIFDKIHVREFTDKLWQQQRCKQSAVSLVDGAYIEAMATLLCLFTPRPMMEIGEDAETKMARQYYNGSATPKEMEKVEILLAQYSITDEQIRAKAMQICGPGISMFNRMETNCETSLRVLRKEHDRRPAVENRKAGTSGQPDAEVVE
jgi:hypothetical protein